MGISEKRLRIEKTRYFSTCEMDFRRRKILRFMNSDRKILKESTKYHKNYTIRNSVPKFNLRAVKKRRTVVKSETEVKQKKANA